MKKLFLYAFLFLTYSASNANSNDNQMKEGVVLEVNCTTKTGMLLDTRENVVKEFEIAANVTVTKGDNVIFIDIVTPNVSKTKLIGIGGNSNIDSMNSLIR